MLIELTVVPFDAVANTPLPDVEERFTERAVVDGFPNWSCSWTVIGPRPASAEAVPETACDVKTSFEAPAALIVSFCVAELRPELAAVRVGDPASVSP